MGVVVYLGVGFGGVGGGGYCGGGLWLVSLIGVRYVMGFCCFLACVSGFGCGKVVVAACHKIGCVCDTM